MLAIEVELLHGTFRGDPDGTANTGGLTRGEWPPAPARLFAAIVAADGTGDRCRVTDGSELEWFERLPPPVIHADAAPCHQRLRRRYVVRHEGSAAKSTHPQYLGRIPVEIRPGVRVAPREPHVVYVWDVQASGEMVDALRRRAARVGYLGAADSPVRMRVGTSAPELEAFEEPFVPDPAGTVEICVPEQGDLQVLDTMYQAWTKHGANIARTPVRCASPSGQLPCSGPCPKARFGLSRCLVAFGRRCLGTTGLGGDKHIQESCAQSSSGHAR